MVPGTHPIDTAPRDGQPICLGDGEVNFAKGFWDDKRGWCYVYTWGGRLIEPIPFDPTCWSAQAAPFLDFYDKLPKPRLLGSPPDQPVWEAPEFIQRAAECPDESEELDDRSVALAIGCAAAFVALYYTLVDWIVR